MHKDTRWPTLWPGFYVADAYVQADTAQLRLLAHRTQLRCGSCLSRVNSVHEYTERKVRDLPLVGRALTLQVQLLRVNCPHCGPCLQYVRWLGRFSRITKAMTQAVADCCARMPTKHVAQMFGLHWATVRQIDKRRLQEVISELPAAQPIRLVMDEFALHKGHRYATVILDADTRRVLYIAKERIRKAIRPFFQALGPQGCRRIEAVAME